MVGAGELARKLADADALWTVSDDVGKTTQRFHDVGTVRFLEPTDDGGK